MKKHIILLFYFVFMSINTQAQQTEQPQLLFENFDTLEPGIYNCLDPGVAIYNGVVKGWTSYNHYATLMNTSCDEYAYTCPNFVDSTGSGTYKFEAYSGTNAVALTTGAYSKIHVGGNCNENYHRVGWGVCYSDTAFYFGHAQSYLVTFKAKNIGEYVDSAFFLKVGCNKEGNIIPNTTDSVEYDFQCINDYSTPGNPGGQVNIQEKYWQDYVAKVKSNDYNSTQLVIVAQAPYGDCTQGDRPYYVIDDIEVRCDPHEVLCEVRKVSDTIDEVACKIRQVYQVFPPYNCNLPENPKYKVEVFDNENYNPVYTLESNEEYFEVEYDIFNTPYFRVLVQNVDDSDIELYYEDEEIYFQENPGNEIVINNGENIVYAENDRVIGKNITIKSGGSLTIQDIDVFLSPTSSIIVERGGKLEVDGARLTACDSWEGIVVKGNTSEPQSNLSQHGVVITKNNAIIEKAICGIGNNEDLGTQNYGGIVHCDNTSFLNCETGVRLLNYREINENYFNACIFRSNTKGVYLERVDGLEFYGNQFLENEYGIFSADSKFEVWDNNIFDSSIHFSVGIHSFASSYGLSSVVIADNEFENLYDGIDLSGQTGIGTNTISNNYFDNCKHGIGLFDENEYDFNNNTLHDCGYGVGSVNTGSDYNKINCNVFMRAKFGNIGFYRDNHNSTFLSNQFIETGTQLQEFDVEVVRGRVLNHIGTKQKPAMNLFSLDRDIVTSNCPAGYEFTYYTPKTSTPHTEPVNPGCYTKDRAKSNSQFECGTVTVPNVTDDDIESRRLDYCNARALLESDPNNPYYQEYYQQALEEFKLYYYYWSIQKGEEQKWEDIEALLIRMCGRIWKKDLYGLYVYRGEYDKAEQVLNELKVGIKDGINSGGVGLVGNRIIDEDFSRESIACFVASQRIALKYHRSKGAYVATVNELNTLLEEVDEKLPESAYARGLYTLLTGTVLPFEWEQGDEDVEGREAASPVLDWVISPNPATDVLNIDYKGRDHIEEASITLYSLSGHKRFEKVMTISKGGNKALDVSGLQNGLYLLVTKSRSGENLFIEKIAITRW